MIRIVELAHHRNGVGGESFGAVRFHDPDEGRDMIGIVFDVEEDHAGGRVAVLDVALAQTTIAFGVNSWRGDHYGRELRAACRAAWPWAPCSPAEGIPPFTPPHVRAMVEARAADLLLGPA